MKALHRSDMWGWSHFDEARNIDFHGLLWVRDGGNVVVDPMPLCDHDRAHLEALGGASWVLVTNSDHVRAAEGLAKDLGAQLAGPAAERETLGIRCARYLADGDELVDGLRVFALDGSKTPGELALVIAGRASTQGATLVTGDLIRAHRGGALTMLPDGKLKDKAGAIASVKRLAAALPELEAVIVGDGWHVFREGSRALQELADTLG